jgi:hypothetical protein
VNGGAPSVGRAAITETARGFMTAFPDMVVKMDLVRGSGSLATFKGRGPVRTRVLAALARPYGFAWYEEWTIDADGLITDSKGHFNEAEYQRQLTSGAPL